MKDTRYEVREGVNDLSARAYTIAESSQMRQQDEALLIHRLFWNEVSNLEQVHCTGPKHNETRVSYMGP